MNLIIFVLNTKFKTTKKWINKSLQNYIPHVSELISRLNYIIKQIRVTMDAEDTIDNIEQMKEAIEHRCLNFKEDKYSMLNSLLHKEKRNLVIDHLVVKDEQNLDKLVTDECSIN